MSIDLKEAPFSLLQEKVDLLAPLVGELKKTNSSLEKIRVLDKHPLVISFCKTPSLLRDFLQKKGLFFSSTRDFLLSQQRNKQSDPLENLSTSLPSFSLEKELALKELIAIDQHEHIFGATKVESKLFDSLMKDLIYIENFYREIGGIVGYHLTVLEKLCQPETLKETKWEFLPPEVVDISEQTESVSQMIAWGLRSLPHLAEVYPVGGAADRLHLQDENTQEELPAAKLSLGGKTLLSRLIEDVQAREYLYYKLFGKQLTTPIALMTSMEKNNYQHVLAICKEHQWFGRGEENFRFVIQPLVPAIDEEGNWCVKGSGQPLLKPGGHGVIWKLIKEEGVFSWLKSKARKKILLRQINNPIAGIDYGLLAFLGWGCHEDQKFGFCSCPRMLQAAEGMNVLMEKRVKKGYEYSLSNIEYCDFDKFGIRKISGKPGEQCSQFLANTNILFADIEATEKAVEKNPFPGLLVNRKSVASLQGQKVGRLESTMQNIADVFTEEFSEKQKGMKKTFITYNKREKTISTAKKVFSPEGSFYETPEKCFFDLLKNGSELLDRCHFSHPSLGTWEEYSKNSPSFLFSYHPALGPFYSVITKKIRGGKLELHSELDLEITELSMENVFVEGSLLIRADNLLGDKKEGKIFYSENTGKCLLKNVHIFNKGIDREKTKCYWKKQVEREQSCEIILQGNGEFIAEDVTIEGSARFIVEEGFRLYVYSERGKLCTRKEAITSPTWFWTYQIEKTGKINLFQTRTI